MTTSPIASATTSGLFCFWLSALLALVPGVSSPLWPFSLFFAARFPNNAHPQSGK